MAKFVEWANSLLGRFEEQVRLSISASYSDFSEKNQIFQDVAGKIDNFATGDFHRLLLVTAPVSNGRIKHASENQHRADVDRTESGSDLAIQILVSHFRAYENASKSE